MAKINKEKKEQKNPEREASENQKKTRNQTVEDKGNEDGDSLKLKNTGYIEQNKDITEEQYKNLDLPQRLRLRQELRMTGKTELNAKDAEGNYQYSQFLREKLNKMTKRAKGIAIAGKAVSEVGASVSHGYDKGQSLLRKTSGW